MEKAVILYYSQGGHTKMLAQRLSAKLQQKAIQSTSVDVIKEKVKDLKDISRIYIGSPVYYISDPQYWREYIAGLPDLTNKKIYLFLTYANTSIKRPPKRVVENFNKMLAAKGGKIINVHGTWCEDTIKLLAKAGLGVNHPDSADIQAFDNFVIDSLNENSIYKIREIKKLHKPLLTYHIVPKIKIRHENCNKCQICIKACPVNNLELKEGKIKINKNCIKCYGCENSCPQNAVKPDWRLIAGLLRVKYDY